ncbi:MAG TPA: DUF4112 domain-containing protein [Caulobacteraceae bacterium]|jgi:hypothetical protein|nr:DUF4112 domain-containing protein [Caulobacteraceae bacterium]
MTRTDAELRSIRNTVNLVGRLSDNIVKLGPLSLGVDGVLSWIPAVGEIYSFGAGAFILVQGARAGVPATVLARAGLILGARTLGDVVPLAGPVFADLFTAHRWAANMIVDAIDRQLGVAPAPRRSRWWRARSAVMA